MWTWSLNWGEVTVALFIGSCPMTPADLGAIARRARVSAVLSLQHRHREAIERRAYDLYEQGTHGDAEADWRQAQAEALRAVLSPPPLP